MELLVHVARLCQEYKEMVFWFVGVGLDEDIVAKCNLPNVKFWGKQDNHELYKFYSAADIFCIPSLYEEGFGRVILEALACGTPVIGSKKGGIPEVVIPEVGMVVNPTDKDFFDAIMFLKNHPDTLENMRRASRPYVENFYSERNFQKILEAYEEN